MSRSTATRIDNNEAIGLIVMGPSGCGKSEVGIALANYYKCQFLDGDSYHSKENIAKMHGGTPLTDSDRYDWLQILRQEIGKTFSLAAKVNADTVFVKSIGAKPIAVALPTSTNSGRSGVNVKVVAGCSALRRSYRDILRAQNFKLIFVFLDCSQELLESRMRSRKGHFMKVDMLASQLKTLEPPAPDEPTVHIKLDNNESIEFIVGSVHSNLMALRNNSFN